MKRGAWVLFRWQARRVALLTLLLAFLLAAMAAMVPEASAAHPAPGLAAFVLALVLAVMVVAPNYPGATAHLIVCGFPRTLVWRQTALAATGIGVLCGLGAAAGADEAIRAQVAHFLKLSYLHEGPYNAAHFPATLAIAVAGAAIGLWIGARLLNATPSQRFRAQVEAAAVGVGLTCVVGGALVFLQSATAQAVVAAAAFGGGAAFLWLSRVVFVRIEPLRD